MTVEHAISLDGTIIAYRRGGAGPALLLVHGTTADHRRWDPIRGDLESDYTVYAMDRRGRGGSGDGPDYAIAREAEDVAAVVETIGGPVFVLGHSYGALCCLEAARLTDQIRRLILYEPPIPTDRPPAEPDEAGRMQALVDQGELEAALELFLREIVQIPERELAAYRRLPTWPGRVLLAPTIPRELVAPTRLDPTRFSDLRLPTLLLLGGESPPFLRRATEVLADVLPEARLVILPGQTHIAMDTAPALFVAEVRRFLAA